MSLKIGLYEEWMKAQVVDLFDSEYGVGKENFSRLMDNFYMHNFQESSTIMIVATEGRTVTGFQSFFRWPYEYQGKLINSYQSGNSLVHPDHRGKGIFRLLLQYLDEIRLEKNIEMLVGFPIEVSKNSLLRNGWSNPFNLTWYIRVVNPAGALFGERHKHLKNKFSETPLFTPREPDVFRITADAGFVKWREGYSGTTYYRFNYNEGDKVCQFTLKLSRRRKWMNELIIGDINTSSWDQLFLTRGFKRLYRTCLSAGNISLISIAFNGKSVYSPEKALNLAGFRSINKEIYFMIKPFDLQHPVPDPEKWIVYRSDIDTW